MDETEYGGREMKIKSSVQREIKGREEQKEKSRQTERGGRTILITRRANPILHCNVADMAVSE